MSDAKELPGLELVKRLAGFMTKGGIVMQDLICATTVLRIWHTVLLNLATYKAILPVLKALFLYV